MSVLHGHKDTTTSLAFSLDGIFLVSGSDGGTVDLWDMQTGGVVKTFHGHTDGILSVSISLDCAVIASGSKDKTIRLWDTQTGECCCTIDGHNKEANSVNFSPRSSQVLISAFADDTIQLWNTSGYQIGPFYEGEGNCVTFSPDGTFFLSWRANIWHHTRAGATVWNCDLGAVVTKLPNIYFHCCCFSPDGRFVVGGDQNNIYIWNITGSDPHLIKTFVSPSWIRSIEFSSSLVTLNVGKSIGIWDISASLVDPVAASVEPTLSTLASIQFIALQTNDGIAISGDSAGVARIWDVSTGLCKASFKIPAKNYDWADAQLIDGKLNFVGCSDRVRNNQENKGTHWHAARKIHNFSSSKSIETIEICIWTTEGEKLQQVNIPSGSKIADLRISGDGSKVFFLDYKHIWTFSISTGKVVGNMLLEGRPCPYSLVVDGSRVWVHFKDFQTRGWDFGISGSAPILLSSLPPHKSHLEFINGLQLQSQDPSKVRDTITGKEVFQLCGRYSRHSSTDWDGRCLAVGYDSGEVLILDFKNFILQ